VREKKERSRRMSNKLVCLQPCSIYIDVFLLNLEYIKDRNHSRERESEKHTNRNDEYCTIYQLVRCLKRLV
jgi:hypothetical protein